MRQYLSPFKDTAFQKNLDKVRWRLWRSWPGWGCERYGSSWCANPTLKPSNTLNKWWQTLLLNSYCEKLRQMFKAFLYFLIHSIGEFSLYDQFSLLYLLCYASIFQYLHICLGFFLSLYHWIISRFFCRMQLLEICTSLMSYWKNSPVWEHPLGHTGQIQQEVENIYHIILEEFSIKSENITHVVQ